MENGNVLHKHFLGTEKPKPFLPRYFACVHAVASAPTYYSEGVLRPAENHCIFHYTLRGSGTCTWHGQTCRVEAGQGFLGIVNDPTSGYAYPADGTEEWEFVCFCFEGGNSMELVREMLTAHGQVYMLPSDCPALRELERWAGIGGEGSPTVPALTGGQLFYALLSELIRLVEAKPGGYHPAVESARRLIGSRIADNPSVDEIAQAVGVSREHLSRLFHRETGREIHTYIREKRISAACSLLKDTDLSVSEIAARMGFSSDSNFSRCFRRTMQMSPAEFRKRGTLPLF